MQYWLLRNKLGFISQGDNGPIFGLSVHMATQFVHWESARALELHAVHIVLAKLDWKEIGTSPLIPWIIGPFTETLVEHVYESSPSQHEQICNALDALKDGSNCQAIVHALADVYEDWAPPLKLSNRLAVGYHLACASDIAGREV